MTKRKTKKTKGKKRAKRAPPIALEVHIHQEGDEEKPKPQDWWNTEPDHTWV